jgi:proline dehydrogenase
VSSPEQTLKLAERSYRAGDFKTARRLAREVIEQTDPDGEIGERAAQILKASGVDPVAIAVFAFTLALLLFLIVRYVL